MSWRVRCVHALSRLLNHCSQSALVIADMLLGIVIFTTSLLYAIVIGCTFNYFLNWLRSYSTRLTRRIITLYWLQDTHPSSTQTWLVYQPGKILVSFFSYMKPNAQFVFFLSLSNFDHFWFFMLLLLFFFRWPTRKYPSRCAQASWRPKFLPTWLWPFPVLSFKFQLFISSFEAILMTFHLFWTWDQISF